MRAKEVKQAGLRLSIKWVLLFLLLLAMVPAYWYLNSPDTFPIKKVEVRSTFRHFKAAEIQSLVAPYVDKAGLFSLKSNQLNTRLTSEPWVDSVSLSRSWPDKIKIEIKEKNPIAYWGASNLLTENGQVFHPPANTLPMKLPHLDGPDGQAKQLLQVYENISRILAPSNLGVSKVQLSPTLSWSVELSNGVTIILGREEPIAQAERLQKVYRRIIGDREGEVEQLDMRYPRGMAVRWRKTA